MNHDTVTITTHTSPRIADAIESIKTSNPKIYKSRSEVTSLALELGLKALGGMTGQEQALAKADHVKRNSLTAMGVKEIDAPQTNESRP